MKTLEEKMEFVVGSCTAGCSSSSRSYNSDLVATTVVLVGRCYFDYAVKIPVEQL